VIGPLAEIAAACDLTVPAAHRRPIGIVGSGAVLDVAHLPVYRSAGIPVPAMWARNARHAERLAKAHGIERVYGTLDELLADPEVAVIDIAVSPEAQVEIALRALDAGKDVMCQKPFALDVLDGIAIAERAEAMGRRVAVQQQMRFEEGILAARAMVAKGWIGEVTSIAVDVNISTDFASWGWLGVVPRLEIYFHSIHYVDTIRSILGEPASVFGTQWRRPGQKPVGETRTAAILVYPGDVRATILSNHENVAADNEARWRIDGSEGSIRGTIGLLYNYPHGRTSTVEVFSRVLPTDGWLHYPVTGRWIPDAFLGPVGSLLRAIAQGGEPETSARDNLATLRVVEALYQSGDTGQAVAIPSKSSEARE
jgi:predicted dehydrogenase